MSTIHLINDVVIEMCFSFKISNSVLSCDILLMNLVKYCPSNESRVLVIPLQQRDESKCVEEYRPFYFIHPNIFLGEHVGKIFFVKIVQEYFFITFIQWFSEFFFEFHINLYVV